MKKTIKTAIFTLLLLTLAASTAFLSYLHFFASDDEDLSGEWTADLDMTQQAAATAYSWLQDIEGVSVSLEDMESRMQGLTIEVSLTFEQTGNSEGTFRCNIDQDSYDACKQAAYETFATAFRELLAERLQMAGYTGSTDEEALEALVTETFGMSADAYLASYGPALLPSLEELQAEYDGSGTYEAAEDVLTRRFDGDGDIIVRMESYIRKESYLILSEVTGSDSNGQSPDDYPVVYTLKQPQEP